MPGIKKRYTKQEKEAKPSPSQAAQSNSMFELPVSSRKSRGFNAFSAKKAAYFKRNCYNQS
jgi:hypothetical protein